MAQFLTHHSYITLNGRRMALGHEYERLNHKGSAKETHQSRTIEEDPRTHLVEQQRCLAPTDLWDHQNCLITSVSGSMQERNMAACERMVAFLDYAAVDTSAHSLGSMHYGRLLKYLSEGRFLVEAYAYVAVDPHKPDAKSHHVRHLRENGWMVNQTMERTTHSKNNMDMEICIDMMRCALQMHPDIIVLCSGDGTFLPVVRALRRMGIRIEVAAFKDTLDRSLPYEASGFISLNIFQQQALSESKDTQKNYLANDMDAQSEDSVSAIGHGGWLEEDELCDSNGMAPSWEPWS